MDVEALKIRMEDYVRMSGQLALGQRSCQDPLERIGGKAIFRVAQRFINDKTIDKFIGDSSGNSADSIYRAWVSAFGKAVYNEFDELELTKIENEYRESAKGRYEMWK